MSCPECQSTRARTRETGLDAEGRKLRLKVCQDCSTRYTTLEVTMPPPLSLYVLSPFRKWRNRMEWRRKRGYHGGIGGQPLKPEPEVKVTLHVRRPGKAA